MAASTQTKFIGATLLTEVEANYNRQIQKYRDIVAGVGQPTDDELMVAWRDAAEAQVRNMCHRLERGEVTDHELAAFRVREIPAVGYWRRSAGRDASRSIERLERERDKSLAFIRSLAAGPDGVVLLGASDMRRIGYEL